MYVSGMRVPFLRGGAVSSRCTMYPPVRLGFQFSTDVLKICGIYIV